MNVQDHILVVDDDREIRTLLRTTPEARLSHQRSGRWQGLWNALGGRVD